MNSAIHAVTGRPIQLGRRQRSTQTKHTMAKAMALHRFLYSLPDAPVSTDNTFGITAWGMMDNDNLGDCTEAAKGHLLQMWTASEGTEVTVPDDVILSAYETECGYVAGDPSTDNGGIIAVVLQDWQQNGLGGYAITAHAQTEMTQQRIQQAIALFGGINGGVELPVSAQSQVGSIWDLVGDGQTGDSAPGSWGGHSTAIVGYDANGLTCVTWGALQRMTWRFFMAYYDEAWSILSPNWKTPFDTTTLENDLSQLSGAVGTVVPVSFPPFVVNP